ncbi:hypothetical protein LDENG_00163320, partial [Lucifuga dentata]
RSSTTEPTSYDLAVFGGKAVRLLRLDAGLQNGDHLHLETLGPLMELQDWALDVRWLSGESHLLLAVALAHNSALLLDIIKGNALVQCSCLEGCLLYSALLLVHESWVDSVLVGGTVFNQLVVWKPGGGGGGAPVERRLLGHSGVIFSMSYLQQKGFLASASDDRSVRARVFSVHLSPGKVFSAGEDGACLVWDWAGGGRVVRTLKGHRAGGVRSLAVSKGTVDEPKQGRWVATGGADGGLRLWRVEGIEQEENEEEAEKETLTDLKFAGPGSPKVVCVAGDEEDNVSWTQSKFLVCTDQGRIYQHSNGQWELIWHGPPEFQSYCVMETVTVRVKDSSDKADLCAVGNLSGDIHIFPISQPQSGILLRGGSGKIHSLIWQKGEESFSQAACLLASGADGLVYRWCIEVKLNENCCLALSTDPLPPFLLPPCAKRWLTAAVRLHRRAEAELWVCGDRRGSLLLFQQRREIEQKEDEEETGEGMRTERNTEEKEDVHGLALQPLSCLFGVHGKQGVTSVCEHQGTLYSTGRDGCVRVFRVRPTPPQTRRENTGSNHGKTADGLQLEVLRVQRACKGMEWLERALILETEIPNCNKEAEERNGIAKPELTDEEKEKESSRDKKEEKEGREARFVIVGFHAVHFVVWDPVRQERLLAVPCAGGRAQIQCYRLLIGWDGQRLVPSCQVIQVARHRLDEQWERRRNRHKTVKPDPETRYMSIAALHGETDPVLLALACSDGAVRLFSISELKGAVELLWESFYHQRCVLSVATCCLDDGKGSRYKLLLTAATDGRIAVWDVTAASSLPTSSWSDARAPLMPCLIIPAHQSGVNSLAVWPEKVGQGCLVTVASGGDDGQLTISTVRVQYPEEETEGSREFSQSLEQ